MIRDRAREAGQTGEEMDYFPMFVDLEDKKIVVVGGGTIATRRVEALLKFRCRITLVAPEISDVLRSCADKGILEWKPAEYEAEDCRDAFFILAATGSREVNHRVYLDAKKRGITVNVCDKKEECDFYFPGTIVQDDVVIGVTSSGSDHRLAKKIREKIEEVLSLL
ncbi:precorrin-2 dehydrogenase/sirohydrochlorin ferrochelatase family protein [Anaerobium acetethylicum]|uniref:precorrin-2 dehydrogenase n=1 Tax=Anaerobium acetethylicum TaxID=1619234 RepID=A0A1D3TXK6_9FIRM|nr:bifunctional precorrin-2 dehydrogenase/sirohydrochlorin ferrochelatase [Anaerobium acetethylicum]SCP99097.1 precorrin-2 dehydrogenase / sirohydrochlorin ferrochelatase/precorrin-6A/cobalt-precorrin-6A reductase [Anaerobium acetethylicum]